MVERIERVARVKGVDYDVGRSFDRKEGYEDQASGKKFSEFFQKARNRQTVAESKIPEAYRLEIGRATQSLFYTGGMDFRSLRSKLSAYQ
ncbi:MAG: hypothetical protein IJT01_12805 [Selenomonadaceae bacterium]|nr:hypothetical protein [Selenomonadaceae bacterium]